MAQFLVYLTLLLLVASRGLAEDRLTVVFGSCIQKLEPKSFEAAAALRPDLFLLLGDSIYLPDRLEDPTGEGRRAYDALTHYPPFSKLRAVTTVMATWDDHDYGTNDADSTYPYRDRSLNLFRKVWGEARAPFEGPSIAREVEMGPALLLITDGRSFRKNTGPLATMFGERQLKWMIERIALPREQVIVIASGTQWLSEDLTRETLGHYRKERERLLDAIDRSPNRVIILSGDRHRAEVYQRRLNKKVVTELTSSPLSGPVDSKLSPVDLWRRGTYDKGPNLGVLKIEDGRVEGGIIDVEGNEVLRME